MSRIPFTRQSFDAVANGVDASARTVGAGENAFWPSAQGGMVADLTPLSYLARLTGERIGSAYGWERVYCSADSVGQITIGKWTNNEANSGTPTSVPAIEPNGTTNLRTGAIVWIRPCEQGGTWQYYIVGGFNVSGQNSGSGTESGADLTTVTIGPYLTDVTIECVTGSGGTRNIRLTKTWGISILTGSDLSLTQQAYVPTSGSGG